MFDSTRPSNLPYCAVNKCNLKNSSIRFLNSQAIELTESVNNLLYLSVNLEPEHEMIKRRNLFKGWIDDIKSFNLAKS